MLRKEFEFEDFNGNVVKEEYCFNLTQAEIVELEMDTDKVVGLEATIIALQSEKDGKKIMDLFKNIIRKSIGKISVDGKRFIKSDEIADEFMQTQAYSDLVMSFIQDSSKGAEFFNQIIPKEKFNQKPAIPAPPVQPIR